MIKKVLTGACLLHLSLYVKPQDILRAMRVYSNKYKKYSVYKRKPESKQIIWNVPIKFKQYARTYSPITEYSPRTGTRYGIAYHIAVYITENMGSGHWWNTLNSWLNTHTKVMKGSLVLAVNYEDIS
ncbi:TPA: hypothetical protein NEG48_001066 [Elizabethkingia anophelis]|nr:hypothetical protein [Elizabethkingia anophelis]